MPKGKPEAGTRKPGGGSKPLPVPRRRFVVYVTDAEREQVQALIRRLRNQMPLESTPDAIVKE